MPGNQCQILGELGKLRKRDLDSLRGKQPSALVQILVLEDRVQVQSHPACRVRPSALLCCSHTHTAFSKGPNSLLLRDGETEALN